MSVQKKIQAHLASDRDLKDQAQRAFLAYLKSIFLMKDKSVFDVFQLDTDSFAASLGLAVPPRVRFLQKHLKNKQAKLEKLTSDNGTEGEETVAEVKKSNKQPILGVLSQDESEGIINRTLFMQL
jgi:ATP-dependent RNA helicase DDX10/DBP4